MRKSSKSITNEQKGNIDLLVLKGYTLRNIAELYGCSYGLVCKYFNIMKSNKIFITTIKIKGKTEAYYTNEDDYGKKPTYRYSELSESEKEIFNKLL